MKNNDRRKNYFKINLITIVIGTGIFYLVLHTEKALGCGGIIIYIYSAALALLASIYAKFLIIVPKESDDKIQDKIMSIIMKGKEIDPQNIRRLKEVILPKILFLFIYAVIIASANLYRIFFMDEHLCNSLPV